MRIENCPCLHAMVLVMATCWQATFTLSHIHNHNGIMAIGHLEISIISQGLECDLVIVYSHQKVMHPEPMDIFIQYVGPLETCQT